MRADHFRMPLLFGDGKRILHHPFEPAKQVSLLDGELAADSNRADA
jgi:hypothetical protein